MSLDAWNFGWGGGSGGGGGGGGFDPSHLTNVTLWMDPTNGVTAPGGSVTHWVDRIGSMDFSVLGTITTGTGINGHATIDSAAESNNKLYATLANPISSIITASAWSFAAVFNYSGTQTYPPGAIYVAPVLLGDSNGVLDFAVFTTAFSAGQYGAPSEDHSAITTSTPYYVFAKYDGSKIYTSVNGGAFTAGTACTANVNMTGYIGIIGNYNQSVSVKGSLGDVVVGKSVWSGSEFTNLATYFHSKWGI